MASRKALLLAILGCVCFFSAVLAARELSDDSAMAARHEQWMAEYNRVKFKANVKFIESFNAARNRKFWLGVNQFADLTNNEFRATKANKGLNPNTVKVPTGFRYENVSIDALPATVDWRANGAVTPIKDQGQCEDQGCNGGEMDDAFKFIIKNGGLTSYPYTAQDGQCKAGSSSVATIKGYEDLPTNNEAALTKAVANQPVSVAVDGGDMTFQFYSGGVMTGSCGTDLDHGIAAIGYEQDSDGTKYWLMKNSWGTTWGENGFLRMEKDISDKRGMCGLAMQPSYPTE
ncbi:senescence-specific cysteine protease SAG39-like [Panicum miliaceum]|uniref:Senescence-specific cysteine protease SAG39-like n=1 Tax=Panicum miliaceum TaxID=4540 RepID=A0A3L6Q3K6_PANMI|nr:senescence-specific cysteine protease SAG39-like [Panicum miliaceum]